MVALPISQAPEPVHVLVGIFYIPIFFSHIVTYTYFGRPSKISVCMGRLPGKY